MNYDQVQTVKQSKNETKLIRAAKLDSPQPFFPAREQKCFELFSQKYFPARIEAKIFRWRKGEWSIRRRPEMAINTIKSV